MSHSGFKFILAIDLERHGKLNQDHLSLLPDKHVIDQRQQYAEDAVLDTPAIEAIQANWAAQAAAASQLEARESDLAPTYKQLALLYADLHEYVVSLLSLACSVLTLAQSHWSHGG